MRHQGQGTQLATCGAPTSTQAAFSTEPEIPFSTALLLEKQLKNLRVCKESITDQKNQPSQRVMNNLSHRGALFGFSPHIVICAPMTLFFFLLMVDQWLINPCHPVSKSYFSYRFALKFHLLFSNSKLEDAASTKGISLKKLTDWDSNTSSAID